MDDTTSTHHITFRILAGVGTIVILLIIALAALLFIGRATPVAQTSQLAPASLTNEQAAYATAQYQDATGAHANLKSSSDAFAQAMKLYNSGQYGSALPLFKEALAATTDISEQTVIKFWIASSDESTRDFPSAIAQYKELAAASTTLSNMTRAYAVQDMAHMFYRYGDPTITQNIFKGDPYGGMLESSDIPLSYRHVFDYATSLYPLALSELYSANWYANQLLDAPSAHPEYKDLIRTKLSLAAADIAQLHDQPSYVQTYLQSLEEEAVVLSKMRRLGDTSYADPEPIFQQLLSEFQSRHLTGDATVRYQYAVYLVRMFSATRATDIISLLSPLVADPAAHGKSFTAFLTNERTNALDSKGNIVRLASVDPDFKTFLLSLGWTAADFK